ncbi:MAG: DUF2541 family protein [Bacteriovoracaceae bacterium]|jgi:hypothetical protein|nr:DUF2541 family protein [Bacteriovoracaceae bacterium]
MKTIIISLLVLAATTNAAMASVRLGAVTMYDSRSTQALHLAKCRFSRNVAVSKVQLLVKNQQTDIDRLSFKFHNGQSQSVDVRENIRPGGKTRWIDLKGSRRCIKKVTITGDTDGWMADPARIVIFGK